MDYTVSLQVQHQLAVFPTHFYQGYSVELQMKSTEVDQGLFTDSYCKVCSAQLISESQRVAHYESRKHSNKVRLYYMLHPVDGGCPAKKLRTDNGSDEGDVDKNKCCTLCNMSFTSAVVAQSHYQGKIHAKRLKLLLGEQPAITIKEAPQSPVKSSPETSPMTFPRQCGNSDRYCQLCNAWFNNPGMAQQHYDGKKHKKNAVRAELLEQLGKTLDMGEMKGLKRSYTCEVCSITLNSVAQYHAHLQGSKHQNNAYATRIENHLLNAARKDPREVAGNQPKFTADYSKATTRRRNPCYKVMYQTRNKGFEAFLIYPATIKLSLLHLSGAKRGRAPVKTGCID
ncbi:zinc finger matrin-type protein 4 [Echeneis naucrates]|uniref:zinc finger matrin-type protein 4 n=1 Tax=Echeneis naucrates TaxID=173247 RepID=UPI0011138E37|nr:zinc finger matrin-type protein 4-like [Echeneis naucrates]